MFISKIIQQYDEMGEDYEVDEMIENQRESEKLADEEKMVLLKNLLSELLSKQQIEILSNLVDNEIQEDTDYLTYDLEEKEKEYWTKYISELKEIKSLL